MLYILVLILVAIIAILITLIEQRRTTIVTPFVPGPETLDSLREAYPDDPYLPLVDDMQYRAQCVGLDGYFVYSVSDDPQLLSSSANSASVADALGRVWSFIKN